MSSTPEAARQTLSGTERALLIDVARRSIAHGLRRGTPLAVDPLDFPPPLQPRRATFVTLERHGALRGCIGTLEATDPLVRDVSFRAHAAAFHDPRFSPLVPEELDTLVVHIAVLGPYRALAVASEAELLDQLRPGIDGLVLEEGEHRATFLPSVWEQLPEPRDFLAHLKRKAGLAPDYWSPAIRARRYTTESFGEEG